MNNNIVKVIGVGVALIVVALAGLSALSNRGDGTPVPSAVIPLSAAVTITIDDLYVDQALTVPSGETVLGLLTTLDATDTRVQLHTKDYANLGVLVESMGGKTNGENDSYWQYTINGVMPMVGADALEVEPGDVIEWTFAPTTF